MEKRVQSPSSIKTYKQCPRKYYYAYILELEQPPNIHTVRGNIAHTVLEEFFDIDTTKITLDDYGPKLKLQIQQRLLAEWQKNQKEFDKLRIKQEEHIHYFEETLMMLFNWLEIFCKKLEQKEGTFQERFIQLTPEREQFYTSPTHNVRGYIDVIEKHETGVRLMDYKTSSSQELDEHLLQLGIYSLLYNEKHGTMPTHVGIYFLKGKETTIKVDTKLLEMAKKEIEQVHKNTATREINDYPKKTSPLCKWSTGQCAFYDICRP
jgi:putative RecB family exonuclease